MQRFCVLLIKSNQHSSNQGTFTANQLTKGDTEKELTEFIEMMITSLINQIYVCISIRGDWLLQNFVNQNTRVNNDLELTKPLKITISSLICTQLLH